jgi:hypothetical protein
MRTKHEHNQYLLAFKRGGSYAARFRGPLGRIKVMALCNQIGGREKPIDCPDFMHKRTNLEVDLAAVDFAERRVISSLGVGRDSGNAAASTLKLSLSKRMQETIELTLKSLADYAAPCQGDAMEGGAIRPACVAGRGSCGAVFEHPRFAPSVGDRARSNTKCSRAPLLVSRGSGPASWITSGA